MKKHLDSAFSIGNVSFPTRRQSPKPLLGNIMPGNKPDKDHVRISLHDLMVLEPMNQEAEDFLNLLESDYNLPYTPTWRETGGKKLRLYEVPPSFSGRPSFTCRAWNTHLEVKTGPGEYYVLPEFRREEDQSKWLPQRSPLDLRPVILPPTTYMAIWLASIAVEPVVSLTPKEIEGLQTCQCSTKINYH